MSHGWGRCPDCKHYHHESEEIEGMCPKCHTDRAKEKSVSKIDWSKAPEDATEAGYDGGGNLVFYKDIQPARALEDAYKWHNGRIWQAGYGTPAAKVREKRPVKEEKPMFKEMKFRVKNSKHCRQIQENLFAQGYKWAHHGQQVCYTAARFLFANSRGLLTYDDNLTTFNGETDFVETILEARTTYNLVEVPVKVAPEVVELNGQKYLKADLEAALKKLTPI